MLSNYSLEAFARLRLRAKFGAEAPKRLQVKMWLNLYGTWFAITGMGGVLVTMALSPTGSRELWAEIIVTAAHFIAYCVKKRVSTSTAIA